jgi:hypothetical protein
MMLKHILVCSVTLVAAGLSSTAMALAQTRGAAVATEAGGTPEPTARIDKPIERRPRDDNERPRDDEVTYCTVADVQTGSDSVELKDAAGAVVIKFRQICITLEEREVEREGKGRDLIVKSVLISTMEDNRLILDSRYNYVEFLAQFYYDVAMTDPVIFPTFWHMPSHGMLPVGSVARVCTKNQSVRIPGGIGATPSEIAATGLRRPLLLQMAPRGVLNIGWFLGGQPCP